jgi:hypothetical protein
MAELKSLQVPEIVVTRLAALAEARKTTAEELVIEALQDLTGSAKTRRAIRKHRSGAPLTDLGWIDGYEGQLVDDILSFAETENAYLVLDKLAESIEQHWKKSPGSRTGVENDIVAVMALLREVGNGGFDQFFRNSSKRWAFFVKSSLIRIGRSDAAKIAGRAVRALGRVSGTHLGLGLGSVFEELDKKMSKPNSRRDDTLEECDQAFYQLKGLAESLLTYAQRHPNGILR